MLRTAIVMRADSDETLDIDDASPAARTGFSLRVVAGPDMGAVLRLDPSGPPHAMVGQSSGSAIQLSDRAVSRQHIALTATATHLLVVDLGSTNGTRVNGVLVKEARLYGGETVTIGRTTFQVDVDGEPQSCIQPMAFASEVPPPPSSQQDFVGNLISEQVPFPAARERVLQDFEKRYIEEVLARHGGNVTRAARASGIAHRYFQLVRARTR